VTERTILRDFIEDGRVHVFDGAIGTLLYSRGIFVNVCYDALALEQPELIRGIHAEYAQAGADILETNTFGANPVKLSAHGLEDRTEEINREAARLAREAAGERAVVGAIGPLGVRLEPWGPTAAGEAEGHFRRQVAGLLEGGVDGFVLETFADVREVAAARRAVAALSDLPVVAQMTIGEELKTSYGTGPGALAEELEGLGADVVGLNCSVGPATILDAIEIMASRTRRPLSAQPNAGLPRTVKDRTMYMATPEYMASYARRLTEAGIRFVGGCCGTTPEHIRRIAEWVGSVQPKPTSVSVRTRLADRSSSTGETLALDRRSGLGAALARGDFVTTVGLLPPRGWDVAELVEQASCAREAGVRAVTILDNPRGHARMAPVPAALVVQREAHVESVVHYACRDRNMAAMFSDFLGAAAGGIRNVLLVSGDPPAQGPWPDSTLVSDIDSVGLTALVSALNRGIDPGGNPLGEPTSFVIGVAVNPGAPDQEREAERFRRKAEAGADFAVTQPVFDPEILWAFLEHVGELKLPVIVGLWPLSSLRNAEFLANEVPGAAVPDTVMERMRKARDIGGDAPLEEGVSIARDVLEAVHSRVAGVHLSIPDGHVRTALQVLEATGVGRR